MITSIYVLSERNGPVRYVGKTMRPLKTRLQAHIAEARTGAHNYRCCWLRHINFDVEIDLVASVPGSGSSEEIALIAELKKLNLRLVNTTAGGEGTLGLVHTESARQKMSRAHKGKPIRVETRKKMSIAAIGHVVTTDTRRKLSKAHTGKIVSAATCLKMSNSHTKITENNLIEMRELRSTGMTYQQIAAVTGFSWAQIRRRLLGRLNDKTEAS